VSASTAGWIAVAAAVLALLGLAAWLWTLVLLRRARAAQKVLLGGGRRDIVDFAVSLQGRIDDVLRSVDEIAAGLSRVDRRVDGAVSRTSIVRYDALSDAGGRLGLAFQIVDDLLDVEGTTEQLGKTAGKDQAQQKATYPAVHGLAASRERARALIEEADRALATLGAPADPIRALGRFILERRA